MIWRILLFLSFVANLGALINFLRNKKFINNRRIPLSGQPVNQALKISVLVPARNEEINIENIVRSIMAQTYKNFEAIICDDQSTDETPKILAKLKNEFPKLKVISGKPLPAGWMGKCWACHNLSQEATGDWLAFFDADVTLHPQAIEYVVNEINNCDPEIKIITGILKQIVGTIGELLIMPGLMIFFYCVAGYFGQYEDLKQSGVMANGQCLWFEHKTYKSFGGHKLVYNQITEDMEFAKRSKALGIKMRVVTLLDHVECRMYRSFKEIWNGFKKNCYPAAKASPLILVAPVGIIISEILPLIYIILGLYDNGNIISLNWFVALLSYTLLLFTVYDVCLLNLNSNLLMFLALIVPLNGVLSIALFIDSLIAAKRGKLMWKNRTYTDEKLEMPKKEKTNQFQTIN